MQKLTIEQLKKYPYPNLMAEIMESGYSICTIGDHMGFGRYCEEDDSKVWCRLEGRKEILASEAVGLAGLFGVNLNYLFAKELKLISGKPYAYWRWLEHNQRKEREYKEYEMRQNIDRALKEKPFLLTVVMKVISMDETELCEVMDAIKDKCYMMNKRVV